MLEGTNSYNSVAVLILAAGKGKRMLNPNLPKVLAKINDKPLIAYVLDTTLYLNPSKIVIVVGFHKQMVIDFVMNYTSKSIDFVEQNDQLGTGHAVVQAENKLSDFKGDVLILCGDVPFLEPLTLQKFIDNYRCEKAEASVLSTFTNEPKGYGRIIRDDKGNFLSIVEEKDANDVQKNVKEINSGVYIVKSGFLFPALNKLSNKNAQGEYYLTDIVEILLSEGKKVVAFPLADFSELQGINSPEELILAENYLKKKR